LVGSSGSGRMYLKLSVIKLIERDKVDNKVRIS
jgi:ABC-type dipeptide/oligopeptide/nickel transport system ATPase component